MSKNRAIAELVFAGVIWGSSFIAVKWSLESLSTYNLLLTRFLLAFIVGLGILLAFKRQIFLANWKNEFKLSMVVGFFLGITLWLQTYGLNFTSATKSSFITSLYVVLIPIIMHLAFRKKSRIHSYLTAFIALVGMYFLVDPQGGQFNRGDIYTFGCAIAASFHIIYTGWHSKKSKDSFTFNIFQNFWSLVFLLPFFIFEKTPMAVGPLTPKVIAGFLITSIGCSMIGFYLQVRAQKVLSTQLSSMLCLLEGPFATFFAFWLADEKLSLLQSLGAAIILASCYLAVYLDREEDLQNPE